MERWTSSERITREMDKWGDERILMNGLMTKGWVGKRMDESRRGQMERWKQKHRWGGG